MITIYTIKTVNKEAVLKRKVNLTTEEHTAKDYISICFGNEAKTKTLISLVNFSINFILREGHQIISLSHGAGLRIKEK